jgi:hypothetical protein
MASFVYDVLLEALAQGGEIDFSRDRFKASLVSGAYFPHKGHRYRNEIVGEVTGFGDDPGGVLVAVKVERNVIRLGGMALPLSSLTARGAVYYRFTGGWMPALDMLVAYVDFKNEISSRDGPFTLTESVITLL